MSNGHGFRLRPLLAVCFAVALLSACDEKKNAAAPPANPAVGVRLAAMKGVSQSFEFVGHIKATDKVDVRARIEGFLEKIAFREGQDLKAGDLLYQIEKVQFQAQVDQAKANLASAEAEATNAQLQYARQYELSRHQFSPQATVDQNKAALDTARAKVLQTQAALTQAQVNLDYTDIRAPIAGRIGRTVYTLGNLVNPASGVLATIVSQEPIYVLFPVSVRDLEIIREARRNEEGGLTKIDIRLRLPDHVGGTASDLVVDAREVHAENAAEREVDRAQQDDEERQIFAEEFLKSRPQSKSTRSRPVPARARTRNGSRRRRRGRDADTHHDCGR